ncbi:hypothetical protein O3M35_009554 [Rhynocoris fuscipes]|uniref:Uncharacterized protein n=1 Tax=Rhynocoris fuscipes TaxID=488301 RepID=A0AAW1D693_9HEMI
MVTTIENEENLPLTQSKIELHNQYNGSGESEARINVETVLDSGDDAVNNIAVLDQENKCIGDIEIHALQSGKRPAIKTKTDGNTDTSSISSKNINVKEKSETNFDKIDEIDNKSTTRLERSFMDFICCKKSYSSEK